MDLKVLRKLNMRRRISCSRAASKYCWGVKYGMAFFLGEDTVDGGWVSSPKRAVLFLGGIEDIDAIDAIDAIEDMGFWGYGLLGMWAFGDVGFWMWAWWDGGDKKVGWRGCEG